MLYGAVQFGILRTYVYEERAVKVAGLEMLPYQRERQIMKPLLKLGRDDNSPVSEAGKDGSLVQTYPASTNDEDSLALYVNVYW